MSAQTEAEGRACLRVVHCTAMAHGGAGRFAERLHRSLRDRGVDSVLLIAHADPALLARTNTRSSIVTRRSLRGRFAQARGPMIDQFPLRFYRRRQRRDFTPAWIGSWFRRLCRRLEPDVVHLHWCGAGTLRVEQLPRFPRPLVWTLHDRWVHTGGCHFPEDCRRWTTGCGRCPILGSNKENDLSRKGYRRKERAYRATPFVPVALSKEAADMVRASPLLDDHPPRTIPNGIDETCFTPGDRAASRRELGIDADTTVVGFGSVGAGVDPRKGADLLRETLACLPKDGSYTAATFGGKMPDLPLPSFDFGEVDDDSKLVQIYRACDVFVISSREEGLPTTALEAQACGIPVAAFAIGGCVAAVADGVTGRLATPFDPAALARAIDDCVAGRDGYGQAGRQRVAERFTMERVTERYLDLYQELVGSANGPDRN